MEGKKKKKEMCASCKFGCPKNQYEREDYLCTKGNDDKKWHDCCDKWQEIE